VELVIPNPDFCLGGMRNLNAGRVYPLVTHVIAARRGKMNRLLMATLFLVCAISTTQAADLKSYKDVYDKNLEEIILGHGPKAVGLQEQYGKALDDLKAKVQGQGDLEKTKAVMAEMERFKKDKNIPEVPSESEIPEIKKLQAASAKQMSDLETDKARKVTTLATQYDGALERLQKELTKAGKIDEATAIQEERSKVRNSDYLTAANRITATVPGKESATDVSDKPAKKAALLNRIMELSLGKGVKMKLALVQAGKFMMGSPVSDESKKPNELPQHEVTISKSFYMGIYEVTQDEHETLMGDNQSKNKGKKYPVTNITWDNAVSFCKQVSMKTGKNVRLPTEAEWEYACRAGTKTRFSFGDDDKDIRKYANYRDRSFTAVMPGVPKNDMPSDGHDKEAPVGSFKPNSWGLYDMHGNTAEWCSDWYDDNYYSSSPAVDPKGPPSGITRVQRGGACLDEAVHMRSARRHSNAPEHPAFMEMVPFCFGFRVVVDTE
jgi:formylglycine-generating enzyme required for sulfatase activity